MEALANPDTALSGRARPRIHYRQRRQRLRRHLHLLAGRRAIRLHAAVDHDSHHDRADRGAGDVRAHGRGHRQGPERPDPRGIWAAAHLRAHGAAGGGQLHQRGHGVHRHRRLAAPVSRIQIHLRAYLRLTGVGAGVARRLQEHGKNLPGRVAGVHRLHLCRRALAAQLARGADGHRDHAAQNGVARQGLYLHGHRRGGHHHRSVDAVLPAIVRSWKKAFA